MKQRISVLLTLGLLLTTVGCMAAHTDTEDGSDGYAAAADGVSYEVPLSREEGAEAVSLRWILHAGGTTPNGYVGSNSIEAMDHSYESGYRAMELDFCWTEDGYFVCIHDWDAYYADMFGKTGGVTREEFESVRYGSYGFTSMTLADVADWMEAHPDTVIITDIKDRNVEAAEVIGEQYPDLRDRFYVQIYAKDDYDAVYNLGFRNIILTVYALSWEEKTDTADLVRFAKTHPLVGLTYPIELHEWIDGYTARMLDADTPLFVHTVNDSATQEALFDLGISGVYTDCGDAQ